MIFATTKLSLILFGLSLMLKFQARRHRAFAKRLKERNLVGAVHGARRGDRPLVRVPGRHASRSGAGLHPKDADVKLMFKNAALGAGLLTPPINWLDQINAQKDFVLTVDGPRGPHQLVRPDRDDEPDAPG